MTTATYMSKDNNWANESTTYWFELNGEDDGTSYQFASDVYGVAESGGESSFLDCDGAPLTEGDHEWIAVNNVVAVTDEMRAS